MKDQNETPKVPACYGTDDAVLLDTHFNTVEFIPAMWTTYICPHCDQVHLQMNLPSVDKVLSFKFTATEIDNIVNGLQNPMPAPLSQTNLS